MIISRIIIAIFAISGYFVEESLTQNEKQALIIDRLTGSVIDLPLNIPESSECGLWANACPAQSTDNKFFAAKNALTENPLFIEQICTENKTLAEAKFEIEICSKYFQISVLFNTENRTFDFGYEVFVSKEKEILFPKKNERENYISIQKLLDSFKRDSSGGKTKKKSKAPLVLVLDEKKTLPYDYDNWKMSFMWISVFAVEFDFQQLTPVRIFYQVRNNNKWPVGLSTNCRKYKLANEVYQKLFKEVYQRNDVKIMYDEIHQHMTFISHILPKEEKAGCRDRWLCVNQWSLIPHDQFHFGASEEKVCSHMATIPIWSNTLWFPLINVDKFLYALYQVLGSPLHIVAGINGHLRLQYKAATEIIFKFEIREHDMYMDMLTEKIPIPDIIYKLVKYKSDDCLEGDSCWYSATIVIHNDPFFNPINRICPDMTAEWGWADVNLVNGPGRMDTFYPSKYIYVCKSEPELLTRLMGASAEEQPQNMRDFDLTKLPLKYAKNIKTGESIETEVFENVLNLTKIQNDLFVIEFERERMRELAKKELKLKKELKHFDPIKKEDIKDYDDSKDDINELIQLAKYDDYGSEGIEGSNDGEMINSKNEEERPLLGNSQIYSRKKNTDKATTSNNLDSKQFPMDNNDEKKRQ